MIATTLELPFIPTVGLVEEPSLSGRFCVLGGGQACRPPCVWLGEGGRCNYRPGKIKLGPQAARVVADLHNLPDSAEKALKRRRDRDLERAGLRELGRRQPEGEEIEVDHDPEE